MLDNDRKLNRKCFWKYVIPSIGSMLVTSLYVVVDGIFVGNGVGADALAAINIAGPYIMIIVAVNMMMTIGGATMTAISMGQKDNDAANNYFSISMKMIIAFSLLITIISCPLSTQIVRALGANDALVEDASCYLMYFVMFCIFFCTSTALAAFVRNDGAPKLAFWGMVSGGLSNIFLDWLFIYPLHMGIMGSAIASGLGQILSCLILVSHFISKKGVLKLKRTHTTWAIILEIFKRGTPEFMNQLFQPITVLCYNLLVINIFGEIGVAAFSVVYYILTISVSIFIGLTQGTQPLISLSYGEGNKKNEKYFYHAGLLLNLVLSVIIYIIMFFAGKPIIQLFNSDPELVSIGYDCIIIYGISFIFTAINTVIISYYTAKKETGAALLLSTLRCIVFIPVCVFSLPAIFGEKAIWVGISVAEVLCILTSIIIDLVLKKKEKNKKIVE